MRRLRSFPLLLVLGVAPTGALIACSGGEPPAEQPKEEGEPVRKAGDNRFEVRRSWLKAQGDKEWAGGPAAEVLIAGEEAGHAGLRVAVRPGSGLAKLGLVNGDLLRAIDGKAVTSADALSALEGLGDAPSFSIELVRKGQPQTLIYDIR